jgi:hypothetical protein
MLPTTTSIQPVAGVRTTSTGELYDLGSRIERISEDWRLPIWDCGGLVIADRVDFRGFAIADRVDWDWRLPIEQSPIDN